MDKPISHLYIAPHLDDAVCSCGGLIREQTAQGERVLVVTLFTAGAQDEDSLPTHLRALHRLWGFQSGDPFASRRAEDRAALALLGADDLHLGWQGALYRQARNGHFLYKGLGLFGTPVREDVRTLARIRRALLNLRAEHPAATFYVPLAVGGHVDHRLAHHAARHVPDPVRYYEDIPYVLLGRVSPMILRLLGLAARTGLTPGGGGYGRAGASLTQRLQGWSGWLGGPQLTLLTNRPPHLYAWQSVLHPIDLRLKFEAILQYASQMPMLFGTSGRAWRALDSYARSLGRGRTPCERQWLWQPRVARP